MMVLPKTIKTRIFNSNKALIDIFIQANGLEGLNSNPWIEKHCIEELYTFTYEFMEFSFFEDSAVAQKISYMSLVHAGFENMLVDFLLKCNVSIDDITPPDVEIDKKKKYEEWRRKNLDKDWEEHKKKLGIA